MNELLDAHPYPYHLPIARELHLKLSQIHPTSKEAMAIASDVQLNTGTIFFEQPIFYIWREILTQATNNGLLRDLVTYVNSRLNAKSPYKNFLNDLLANTGINTQSEPLSAQGVPNFLRNDDNVLEPEALLYYDDLTIPIGEVSHLITTLQAISTLAPGVCYLNVKFPNARGKGTGFRIGQNLLLTNWHVLHLQNTKVPATAVTAEFGFEDDGADGVVTSTPLQCDVTTILADETDDWAVIKTSQDIPHKFPIIDLNTHAAPVVNSATYIIQHPGGERKRLGFVRNQICAVDDLVIQYLTDTKDGSSGSPVFNKDGKLVGLHHAGGRPQEIVGKPPVRKNEGIRITRVLQGFTNKGVVIP